MSPSQDTHTAAPLPTLPELRVQIDALDQNILSLLNQRARVAEQVGEVKRREGTPFFRPDRVAQVIENIRLSNQGPLQGDHVTAIWREIMSACLALEAPQRVAVLGPPGTLCEQAALEYFGSAAEMVYCANFDEVFQATAAGNAQFGVVGVENSTEGVVTRSLDLFLHTPTHVVGEVSLMVRHNLLRLNDSLDGVEVVLAHPQALAQCQTWLSRHLPNAERRAVSSNAEGARLASTNPGLVVSVENRPGALHDLLVPLKNHGVSMTRFESRPARTGQWEYFFYIDLQGHASQPHVAQALTELKALCAFFKVLGTYPVND